MEAAERPMATLKDLQECLANTRACMREQSCILHRSRLWSRVARQKLFLIKKSPSSQTYLSLAKMCYCFNNTDIECFAQNSIATVCLMQKQAYHLSQKNIILLVKHGGGSTLLLGCFSSAGTGSPIKTNWIIQYIVSNTYLPTYLPMYTPI